MSPSFKLILDLDKYAFLILLFEIVMWLSNAVCSGLDKNNFYQNIHRAFFTFEIVL